jgi:phenylacetate-CoA ligase
VRKQGQLAGQYQIVVTREGTLDEIAVRCELQPGVPLSQATPCAAELQQHIKAMTGISAEVVVGGPDTIERTLVGKARRVIDKRPRG